MDVSIYQQAGVRTQSLGFWHWICKWLRSEREKAKGRVVCFLVAMEDPIIFMTSVWPSYSIQMKNKSSIKAQGVPIIFQIHMQPPILSAMCMCVHAYMYMCVFLTCSTEKPYKNRSYMANIWVLTFACYAFIAVFSALSELIHFILTATLWNRYSYYPQFENEKTEM